ncbi:MAG: D-ribose ABC transporter substrate-binding protein [Nitrospiraceae bacterium]|nr:MAG: D-ribose ABC transporter substrate-binding protein [Nitrospiraceae bacterium]
MVALIATAARAQGTQASQPLKGKTIAYIQTDAYDYYIYGTRGAQIAIQQLGGRTRVYNSAGDPQRELANVQDAITQKVDGIVLFPLTLASEKSALRLAARANVPVVVLYGYDKSLEQLAVSFHQVDLVRYGQAIGMTARRMLPTGKMAIITGLKGRGDAEAYAKGFRLGFRGNARIVEELDGKWSRQEALKAAQDIITKHPDLKGLFVQNEDMAAGAISGLGAKARQVKVFAMNGSPAGLRLLRQGKIAATVGLSPSAEAAMAVKSLSDHLAGKPPKVKLCNTPFAVNLPGRIRSVPWPPTQRTIAQALRTPCANQ